MDYKPWSDNLLQLKDDHWKHIRSQLSPTFSSGKLKKVISRISIRRVLVPVPGTPTSQQGLGCPHVHHDSSDLKTKTKARVTPSFLKQDPNT